MRSARHWLVLCALPALLVACPASVPALCDNGACEPLDGGAAASDRRRLRRAPAACGVRSEQGSAKG